MIDVTINDYLPSSVVLTSGVLQRSHFCPFLFLPLCKNNMFLVSQKSLFNEVPFQSDLSRLSFKLDPALEDANASGSIKN